MQPKVPAKEAVVMVDHGGDDIRVAQNKEVGEPGPARDLADKIGSGSQGETAREEVQLGVRCPAGRRSQRVVWRPTKYTE